ncbi:MAG: OFA family MFS transporter [Candidatus Aminicenantes bacterium]|nr:OFA family MFS transporter [Candidatus Aminicenantes bacterium]
MAEGRILNRWIVVAGAVLIQLCLGAIYAWSVFTKPLVEAGWTRAQTQGVFSAGLAAFAVVMVLAGRLMPRIGPRRLAILGGFVLGTGYILAGTLGGTDFPRLLVFIGLIGGTGIGLAYVVPIAVGMRWFPDRKGLITGLAVAGFGFGATGWVKIAGSWGNLIADRGLSATFTIYGLVFLAAVILGGLVMAFPPESWKPQGWEPPETAAYGINNGEREFTSRNMLRTPQYYMILLTFVFGAGAGLMSIGLMKLFPMVALTARGMDSASASAIAGTAMAVFFSLANGLGRIVWGAICEKLGVRISIAAMMAAQGIMVLVFPLMAGTKTLLYVGAAMIGFNFGGNFALFPMITAETFGTRSVGQNYGWVFLAYGIGGIAGPIMGGKLGDLDNFPLAFTICGALCLLAAIIISRVRPPIKSS